MDHKLWNAANANAANLNVETAALMAVIEVESGGQYFANVAGKQEPLIRFEGHYFDKRLSGSARARARLRGLGSQTAGAVKNPAAQKDRWVLLEKACSINRLAALESTSWGVGQVMGAHWKWLGYNSVEELVEAARSGLEGQVELMVRYIDKSGLSPALRHHDWSAFARGYNGPSYAKFGYHTKLVQAYKRIVNTRSNTMQIEKNSLKNNILRLGDKGQSVEDMQHSLTALGYPVTATAIFDKTTQTALKSFQHANAITADGIFGPQTADKITIALPRWNFWQWLIAIIKRGLYHA
jgi:N-acetylmuramidase/Putative peptidoglycan binding domain